MLISWPSIIPVSLRPYAEQVTPSSSKGTWIASYLELSTEGSPPVGLSGRVNQLSVLDFFHHIQNLGRQHGCIGDCDVAPVLICFALFHAVEVSSPQSL